MLPSTRNFSPPHDARHSAANAAMAVVEKCFIKGKNCLLHCKVSANRNNRKIADKKNEQCEFANVLQKRSDKFGSVRG